jgi:hypothetical protein
MRRRHLSVTGLQSEMKIAIHQSHYLPWLRYWAKVAYADVFVLLDDVQFTKNDWQNRNKIKGPTGEIVLTVPVYQKLGQKISDVLIDNKRNWARKHLQSIILSYGKSDFFSEHISFFENVYGRHWEKLIDINNGMFSYLKDALSVKTEIIRGSELKAEGEGSLRLVNICRALGGTVYLTGRYASEVYLDRKLFQEAGIEIEEQRWECPVYNQLFVSQGFIPDLSIIDLLFNCGGKSLDILMNKNG